MDFPGSEMISLMDTLIMPGFLLVAGLCAWIDARTYRIPDFLSLGFLCFAITADCLGGGLSLERIASAAAVAGVLYLAGLISGAGIGLGDVKLGAAGGYALGLSRSYVMLALAVLAGLLAFTCLPEQRGSRVGKMPFGPLLALGAYSAALMPPFF